MKRPTREAPMPTFARILLTFGGAAAVFLSGLLTFAATQRAAENREWVTHTQSVLEAAGATLGAMQDAETGQRGYLLTGDSTYLDPYLAARTRLTEDTLSLRSLTRDNALQQARLDILGSLVQRKMAELEETLAMRHAGEMRAAQDIVRSGRGKAVMDSIRVVLRSVNAEEQRLLAERREDAEKSATLALAVILVGTFAAIACALLLNGVLGRYADDAARNSEILRDQNDLLSEQTIELETQAEHLQEQATRLETANENLEVQVRISRAASEAKSDFLAAMSHELRTPLNAIDGYTELMLMGVRGELTAEQRADVERIKRSSRHLLTLINQLLNMAKVESGDADLHASSVALRPLLEDVEVLIRPQMDAKGIAFSIDACDAGAMVYADPDRVKQILLNLVANAQKFTDPGGRVHLGCGQTPDGHRYVDVTDTGRGIPGDKLAEIFEPFAQLNRLQTPDSHRGIGLGLSISRTLAHAMQGDLTVTSVLGQGSTFRLTLPAAAAT